MLRWLKRYAAMEPAILAWAVNGGLALVLAFIFHISGKQEAAVTTIATALATAYTAWKAGPSGVPVLIGALATGVTAAGAFGFHPSAQVLATVTAVASAVLPLVFRVNLTPKAATTAPARHEGPQHAAPHGY